MQDTQRDHRDPVRIVVDAALASGTLDTAREARLVAIADRVEAAQQDKAELKRELRVSASEVVRSGTTNTARFDDAVDKALSALEARAQLTIDAVTEVHALLDGEQRAAVAAALRDHLAQRVAARERRAKRRDGFKKVATHLMLTGAQLDEIRDVRKELLQDKEGLRPTRAQLEALIDAFAGDDFAAAVASFHDAKRDILRAHVAKVGDRADLVLSLLAEDQRELLAELIELGPEAVGLNEDEASSDRRAAE